MREINSEILNQYIQRYSPQNVGSPEKYYISLPQDPRSSHGFAEVLANRQNLRVNYFWGDNTLIAYRGSFGPTNGRVVNILLRGSHFVPLFDVQQGDQALDHFAQSIANAYFEQVKENVRAASVGAQQSPEIPKFDQKDEAQSTPKKETKVAA